MSYYNHMNRRSILAGIGLGVVGVFHAGRSAAGCFFRHRRGCQHIHQPMSNQPIAVPQGRLNYSGRVAKPREGLCNAVQSGIDNIDPFLHVCHLSYLDSQTGHQWISGGYLVNRMVGNTLVNRVIITSFIFGGTSSVTITPASLSAANKPLGDVQVSSLSYRLGKRLNYIVLPDTTLVDRIAAKYVPSLVSSQPFGVGDANYFNTSLTLVGYDDNPGQDTFIPRVNYNFSGHDRPPQSYDSVSMQIANGWPNMNGSPVFGLGSFPNGGQFFTLVGILDADYIDYGRCIVKGWRITQDELDEMVKIQKNG